MGRGFSNNPHFICGDFNLPNIDWSVPVSLGGLTSDFFICLCRRLNLMQVIQEHTCNTGHILDLLLCDVVSSSNLLSHEICPPLAHTCDHSGFCLKLIWLLLLLQIKLISKMPAMIPYVPNSLPLIGAPSYLLAMTMCKLYMILLYVTYTSSLIIMSHTKNLQIFLLNVHFRYVSYLRRKINFTLYGRLIR